MACCAAQVTDAETVVIQGNDSVGLVTNDVEELASASPVEEDEAPTREADSPGKAAPASPAPAYTSGQSQDREESAGEFTVSVSKAGKPLGIELGLGLCETFRTVIWLEDVAETGVLAEYNKAAPADKQISSMDYIIKVNMVVGSGMVERLQKDEDLEITVKKAEKLTLTIPKGGEGSLGMDLLFQNERKYLFVKGIQDGTVKSYNETVSRDKQLKLSACIISVDGFEGTAAQVFTKIAAPGSSMTLVVSQPGIGNVSFSNVFT